MKVYGFDETDVQRGEMQAAKVDPVRMHFHGEARDWLGWEFLSARFAEAKAQLVRRMTEEEVDPEMITAARGFKASMIPVEDAEA